MIFYSLFFIDFIITSLFSHMSIVVVIFSLKGRRFSKDWIETRQLILFILREKKIETKQTSTVKENGSLTIEYLLFILLLLLFFYGHKVLIHSKVNKLPGVIKSPVSECVYAATYTAERAHQSLALIVEL